MNTPDDAAVRDALTDSQRLGMLGRQSIDDVMTHSDAFVQALQGITGTVVDLGTGGGVPGLVVAVRRPDLRVVLLDRRATRTDHVLRLVARLDLGPRVMVVNDDAIRFGERIDHPADAITARGYGPPASVARAAAPMLRTGGVLVVSEPPQPTTERWTLDLLQRYQFDRVDHADRRVAVLRRL